MEADTPEQFPRYGQYPSLCSADPPPLRNSEGRGGKGCTQATNNLTHAHCKEVLLDSPWCILVPRATRPGQRKRRVVGTRMVSILQGR